MLVYNFNYFFRSSLIVKVFKKISKGGSFKVEYSFERFLFLLKKKKKMFNFFLLFLEALSILAPYLGVKIFKFSKNKNVKRKKKGVKVSIRTKVIPEIITKRAKYNLALR